ncbi:MAG: NAD(P)/FAD-dependent oxidoreductase [Thermomicrobia bacterium]|nr:NAD(P)/FAD-dependent oxidoreductase [Thermomicrobia bacterium]
MSADVVVIGAGHNGLACACYLARAGCNVHVLEMADHFGGAVHTTETIADSSGYRFDTCSVIHNMINMTTVIEELCLQDVGLAYIETDPFTISYFPDGKIVRFYRSVDRTCDEIARHAPCDAEAYARFIRAAGPVTELALGAFRSSGDHGKGIGEWRQRLVAAGQALRRNRPTRLVQQLTGPYGALLEETFQTEYARAGIASLAAHGTLGPQTPGAAFFVFWQAAYHRYGNWHAQGGSGALASALKKRLEAWGGTVRTGARVDRILVNGRVRGVELADGERIEASRVVAAINPQTALLQLVGRDHLPTDLARRIATRHRSNAVQFVVHAALDRLPPWRNAPADGWNGMQSIASSVAQVGENFRQAEAGIAPTRPAAYIFTPSAIDATVAPHGKHGAYIACASYPARFADGASWLARGEGEAHRLVAAVEERAPGFADGITGLAWRHAEDWERDIGLLGGHPMHLDLTLDQLGAFRPLPELANHRSPIDGLYLTGAGTYPTGGVSAVPGRVTARVVLRDIGTRRKE